MSMCGGCAASSTSRSRSSFCERCEESATFSKILKRVSAPAHVDLFVIASMFRNPIVSIRGAAFASAALALTILQAQPPNQTPGQGRGRGIGRGGPVVVSPQIESDGRVTFRIYAPQASTVTVNGDIAGGLVPAEGQESSGGQVRGATPAVLMNKGADGIWSGATIRAVKPGAWRYTFSVDGVTTVDSRNVLTSPSQTQMQSLLVVPGDFSETRDVPHGAVSQVRYVASALGNARREMYIYTPPDYEKGA